MRAVWSFWSRPHRLFYNRLWHSERAHLLCWALSVAEAARHVDETCLITEDAGAALLAGGLGLPFTSVSTGLESLNREAADPQWWVLGKLTAYAAQAAPFIHLDADVILWNPPPARLRRAPLFAQNPEHFDFEDQSLYRPDNFMAAIEALGGWMPAEWRGDAGRRRNGTLCCGILGGADTRFIGGYAPGDRDHPSSPQPRGLGAHRRARQHPGGAGFSVRLPGGRGRGRQSRGEAGVPVRQLCRRFRPGEG
jgi:hypothetical protein